MLGDRNLRLAESQNSPIRPLSRSNERGLVGKFDSSAWIEDSKADGDTMVYDDAKETERSLLKTNRVCKFICMLMKLVFLLLCVWWTGSIGVMGCSLVNPDILNNVIKVNALMLAIYFASVVVMVVACLCLIRIFSDASKGSSPFTMVQVRRLRLVAGSLLLYGVLEFVMTIAVSSAQQGFANMTLNGEVATINLFPLVAAAVVFAFFFVFKYGVLLQELSDDTI